MPEFTIEQLGEMQVVSRRIAAQQQIEIAIRLFQERKFACSITLALAAEDQLPNMEGPYLFNKMKEDFPDRIGEFNDLRNWLKHCKEPEEMTIYEFEVETSLMRAVSKFAHIYREISGAMAEFDAHCVGRDIAQSVL